MRSTATYIPGRKIMRVTVRDGDVVATGDIGPQIERDGELTRELVKKVRGDLRASVREQMAARRRAVSR